MIAIRVTRANCPLLFKAIEEDTIPDNKEYQKGIIKEIGAYFIGHVARSTTLRKFSATSIEFLRGRGEDVIGVSIQGLDFGLSQTTNRC